MTVSDTSLLQELLNSCEEVVVVLIDENKKTMCQNLLNLNNSERTILEMGFAVLVSTLVILV